MTLRLPVHPRCVEAGPRARGLAWLALVLGSFGWGVPVASASSQRIMVLRDDQGAIPARLAGDVDRTLRDWLHEREELEATFSPSPFDEVALMAECTERSPAACALAISRALETDWLLIRQIRRDADGTFELSLVAADGPDAIVSRRTTAALSAGTQGELNGLLPLMLSQLYSAPRSSSVATTKSAREAKSLADPPDEPMDPRSIIGWSSVAAGGVLLTSALIVGGYSRRSERAYSELEIVGAEDAKRARGLLDQAERRADSANALFLAGGAMAVLGAGMLVWGRLRERRSAPSLQVAAVPHRDGASVLLAGQLWGGSR